MKDTGNLVELPCSVPTLIPLSVLSEVIELSGSTTSKDRSQLRCPCQSWSRSPLLTPNCAAYITRPVGRALLRLRLPVFSSSMRAGGPTRVTPFFNTGLTDPAGKHAIPPAQ